jgi:hypothetical protein
LLRRVDRSAADGALRALRQIRRFARKAAVASSFVEVAQLAVVTTHDVIAADGITSFSPDPSEEGSSSFVLGRRAPFWRRATQAAGYEQHRGLPSGRVAVSENVPLPEEIAGPTTALAFEYGEDDEAKRYAFEIATAQWHEINRIRIRSGIVLSLREGGAYRGILGACWVRGREASRLELELLATIGAIVELASV